VLSLEVLYLEDKREEFDFSVSALRNLMKFFAYIEGQCIPFELSLRREACALPFLLNAIIISKFLYLDGKKR
jgi:hypothetical protein